jgi:hypothetical protein
MFCPFCSTQLRDLFALSPHLEDEHPGRECELVVGLWTSLPVIEIDIDAIHRTRPTAAAAS